MASLSGKFELPARSEMLEHIKAYMGNKFMPNSAKYAHNLGGTEQQDEYFEDLATTGNIRHLPRVYCKLHGFAKVDRNYDHCFKLLDDENFILLDNEINE